MKTRKRTDLFLIDPWDVIIVTDPVSPYYDSRSGWPVDDSMVKSMLYRRLGNIEPVIIVRDGDQHIVVAGKQRVKALRAANEELSKRGEDPMLLKCIYQRTDEHGANMLTMIENAHRRNNTPDETASLVEIMLNRGMSSSEIALALGKSLSTVRNAEKYIELPDTVKQAVRSGEISASTAVAELSNVSSSESNDAIEKIKKAPKKRMRNAKEIKEAIKLNLYPEHVSNVLKWVLREDESLVICDPVYKNAQEDIDTLKQALCDLLDGNCTSEWILQNTGLDQSRCEEIEELGNFCLKEVNDE